LYKNQEDKEKAKNRKLEKIIQWGKNNPEKTKKYWRKYRLKKQYNITPEIYDNLFIEQNGVCAICGKKPDKKILSVDHDHITGQIRGLICNSCNLALGCIEEDILILKKMIKYINSYRKIDI
jgi:hypothetical protein